MILKKTPSATYSQWLANIVETHKSQSWNKQLTEADEQKEEELNGLWAELDDAQKQRLWGLSADLYTLRDQEKWVDSDWPPMSEEELGRAQAEAFHAEEWDRLLELLRRPPRFRPRPTVDYMRAQAWREMGHPEVALLFLDNATRLDPANAMYAEVALGCLMAVQDWPEILRRCDFYVQNSATPPRLLFRAADALRAYADQSGTQRFYRESIKAVDEGVARSSQSNSPENAAALLASAPAYATKGLCLLQLGEAEASLKVLDDAVAKFPHKTQFLFLRGAVRQELGVSDALTDFRKAVEGGSEIAWPYIELARDAFQAGQNQYAVNLACKGLEHVRRPSDRAILFELLAIASTRSQSNESFIRQAFRSALELDPLNERIRTNSNMFESYMAIREAPEPQWKVPESQRSVPDPRSVPEPQWKLPPTPPREQIPDRYSHFQPAA